VLLFYIIRLFGEIRLLLIFQTNIDLRLAGVSADVSEN
jgi:hypothetical protein